MNEAGSGWEQLALDPAEAAFPAPAHVAGVPMWVFRVGAGFRGVQDMCPHERQSLGEASIVGGEKMIRCAYHNYTFKLSDGKGVNCPGFSIATYEIKEEAGRLFARAVTA